MQLYTRREQSGLFQVRTETGETESRTLPNARVIQTNKTIWVDEPDSAKQTVLAALYAQVMTGVTEYSLISFDVVDQGGTLSGIVNYRIGTAHQQKRF
jgi:hypothetical protein